MSSLTDTMRGMGRAKSAILAGAAVVLLGFFMFLSFRMSTGGMTPLYTGLSLEDSSKIIAELEKTGTPYELLAGGSAISVPPDRVLRLRMNMAGAGLPSGGSVVGYEIFDRSETFGSSNFVMNINMMRALEGELSRTIASINGVESARVHLVVPKRELFTRDKDKPSASVTIKMRGGHSLEHAEVGAISHLVAAGVPGLESSKVTIVDSHGKLLARGDGGDGMQGAASTSQEFRVAYETRMQQKLEEMLEKVVGSGKARVQVTADMNFDRIVTNSEKFDPEGQVARSTQSNSEKESSQEKEPKETVTVGNNLPAGAKGGDQGAASNQRNTEKADETTNYEISKTMQNHVSEGGNVTKLSVAVLVDGTYAKDADDKETYTPRTEDELKQLRALINSAAGFDEKRGDRIEVVNMRFTNDVEETGKESFFERFKFEMQSIIQTLIIAVVAILTILLVLRPAVMQMLKSSQSPNDRVNAELAALDNPGMAARLPGTGGQAALMDAGGMAGGEGEALIDVANVRGGMRSSSVKKINDIVEKYPEETMGVLRQWVTKAG